MEYKESYCKAIKNFAGSKLFFKLFDETISLVQKTSDYLEGTGRFDQLKLEGKEETYFATESIKMTNRLVFASSWLLSHRAYFKGDLNKPKDIELNEILDDDKLSLDKMLNSLPARFTVLVTQSNLLFERILRLDNQLRSIGDTVLDQEKDENGVHNQLERLKKGLEEFNIENIVKKDDVIYLD